MKLNDGRKEMNRYNLDVPIYLNQKVVFDLLASINNGLAQVTKLRTSSNVDTGVSGGLESELGNKNIFTLLGVNLKGRIESGKNQEQEQEKVHTPASLFNCLKGELFRQKLVKKVCEEKDFREIKPGDFVEVNGLIKLNPLVKIMNNMTNMMELAVTLQGDGTGKNAKKENIENKRIIGQMNAFADSLQENGMVDLICETKGNYSFSSVLPVYMDYFFNGNMSEIVDGKFKVIGKVTKISMEQEKIDLLRNTSFTLFRENILKEMLSAFNADNNGEINAGDVQTSISSPALLIIPIAIYI